MRGERRPASCPCPPPAGHPRACGENGTGPACRWGWGRAIPARAGRTVSSIGTNVVVAGPSPRVRGERRQPGAPRVDPAGHPRACGENPFCRGWIQRQGRAIPARAGRTMPGNASCMISSGPSPRVRGELQRAWSFALPESGHPRACGENGAAIADTTQGARAIPARAGRTVTSRPSPWPLLGPSPRVRGERPKSTGRRP